MKPQTHKQKQEELQQRNCLGTVNWKSRRCGDLELVLIARNLILNLNAAQTNTVCLVRRKA